MSKKLAEKYQSYIAAWRERLAEESEEGRDTELRDEARRIAKKCAQILIECYDVRKVYLFGSATGRGTFHKYSDIDLAVEGLPEREYLRALTELWDCLPPHLSLDLVTLESARPELVELVLNEGVSLHDDSEAQFSPSRHPERA